MRLFETSGLSASSSQWAEIALRDELAVRDARWSEAVAGSLAFVEKVNSQLGFKAAHREVTSIFKRCLGRNPKSKIQN